MAKTRTRRRAPAKTLRTRRRTTPHTKTKPAPSPTLPARASGLIAEPRLLTPSHPQMKRLGSELVKLRADKERDYLERCVLLGLKLRQARTQLSHGDWQPWLAKQAKLGLSTANNYITLSLWAEQNPKPFARYQPLGASKLLRIVATADSVRAKLRKRSVASLDKLSVREFSALVLRLSDRDEVPETQKQQASVLRRSNRILRDVHDLLDRADADEDALASIREVLLEAAEALHN